MSRPNFGFDPAANSPNQVADVSSRPPEAEPINEREQIAARAGAAVLRMYESSWKSIIDRLEDQQRLNPAALQSITDLPAADVERIFTGLQARGKVGERPDKYGYYPVLKKESDEVPEDAETRDWGVVIVNHVLNGHDFRKRVPEVFPPRRFPDRTQQTRTDPSAQQPRSPRPPARQTSSQRPNSQQTGGTTPGRTSKPGGRPQQSAPRTAGSGSTPSRGQRQTGGPAKPAQTSPRPAQTGSSAAHQERGRSSRPAAAEKPKVVAKDYMELSFMYLAGLLSRDGTQPPSMSPMSLARKCVRAFGLDRQAIAAGQDHATAAAAAERRILPEMERNFDYFIRIGFITEDRVKIDPNNPSHDKRAIGHRVVADKATILGKLNEYRANRDQ